MFYNYQNTTKLKLEGVRLFRVVTLFMLCIMVVRHSMFYFRLGVINSEMGSDQSFFGVMLIPVTASFGFLFFWRRPDYQPPRNALIRYIFIGSIPIFISLNQGGIFNLLSYDISSFHRRPSFLILLPISLSIIWKSVRFSVFLDWFLSGVLILLFHSKFVVYYLCMFNVFRLLHGFSLFNKLLSGAFFSVIYICVLVVMLEFSLARIPFILELLFGVGYIASIEQLVNFFSKSFPRFVNWVADFKGFSVFYFYVSQAVFFNILQSSMILEISASLSILLVLVGALMSSHYVEIVWQRIFDTFLRRRCGMD